MKIYGEGYAYKRYFYGEFQGYCTRKPVYQLVKGKEKRIPGEWQYVTCHRLRKDSEGKSYYLTWEEWEKEAMNEINNKMEG